MELWKTIERTLILDHSKWLQVENHTILLPGGKRLTEWPWLICPDFVNVFPVTQDGTFMCFRQTKYAIEGTGLAPVGGYIEPGEEPLLAAKRELLEETGFAAAEWMPLGTYVVDGNHGAGKAHLYLAKEVQKTAEPTGGDLEEQELVYLHADELRRALAEGEIKVLSWAAGVAMALLALSPPSR